MTNDIVVDLFGIGVNECCGSGEGIVVVDDEGQVGHRLSTFIDGYVEMKAWLVVRGVDIGRPSVPISGIPITKGSSNADSGSSSYVQSTFSPEVFANTRAFKTVSEGGTRCGDANGMV